MKFVRDEKRLVDQVSEVLSQNRKILDMNERLLLAILNLSIVMKYAEIDVDAFRRSSTSFQEKT